MPQLALEEPVREVGTLLALANQAGQRGKSSPVPSAEAPTVSVNPVGPFEAVVPHGPSGNSGQVQMEWSPAREDLTETSAVLPSIPALPSRRNRLALFLAGAAIVVGTAVYAMNRDVAVSKDTEEPETQDTTHADQHEASQKADEEASEQTDNAGAASHANAKLALTPQTSKSAGSATPAQTSAKLAEPLPKPRVSKSSTRRTGRVSKSAHRKPRKRPASPPPKPQTPKSRKPGLARSPYGKPKSSP